MLQRHHQPFIFKIIHTGCACRKYASEFAIDGMMKVTVTEEFMPPLVDLIAKCITTDAPRPNFFKFSLFIPVICPCEMSKSLCKLTFTIQNKYFNSPWGWLSFYILL
jgi:hypothetical protein